MELGNFEGLSDEEIYRKAREANLYVIKRKAVNEIVKTSSDHEQYITLCFRKILLHELLKVGLTAYLTTTTELT